MTDLLGKLGRLGDSGVLIDAEFTNERSASAEIASRRDGPSAAADALSKLRYPDDGEHHYQDLPTICSHPIV